MGGKETLIVANHKSSGLTTSIEEWARQVSAVEHGQNITVIVCPDFTLLERFASLLAGSGIKVGAQDISPFEKGAYTGEVNGEQIKRVADYVVIGHSERRTYFAETDKVLEQKVAMANKYGLIPIFCVQNGETPVPKGVGIVAYEPVFAIGSGTPDTPENANATAKKIKEENGGVENVLYGGSVNGDNVGGFLQMSDIGGVLVGGASLDPQKFIAIIKNA